MRQYRLCSQEAASVGGVQPRPAPTPAQLRPSRRGDHSYIAADGRWGAAGRQRWYNHRSVAAGSAPVPARPRLRPRRPGPHPTPAGMTPFDGIPFIPTQRAAPDDRFSRSAHAQTRGEGAD